MADPRNFGKRLNADDITDFKGAIKRSGEVVSRIFTRLPAVNELGEGEQVFSIIAGVRRLHVKIQGVVVSTTLT